MAVENEFSEERVAVFRVVFCKKRSFTAFFYNRLIAPKELHKKTLMAFSCWKSEKVTFLVFNGFVSEKSAVSEGRCHRNSTVQVRRLKFTTFYLCKEFLRPTENEPDMKKENAIFSVLPCILLTSVSR